jgi:hypothetical protein
MSTPTIHAMADQTMAAIDEAQRLAPDNGHLHEHHILSAIMRDNMGRPETEWTVENPDLPSPRPKIVHSRILDADHAPPADLHPDFKYPSPCTLCNTHAGYTSTRRLWVNAGLTIFEFDFCEFHQIALEAEFGSPRYVPGLVWKD